jgi:dethiobiotin synthetase
MTDQEKRVMDYRSTSVAGIAALAPYDERGERSSLSLRLGDNSGLTILGTEVGCGKTAFMTGLTASLRQEGVAARAVKPVCIGPRDRAEAELSFISSITGTPRSYPASFVPSAKHLTNAQWSQALSICLNAKDLTMVETPASLSSAMTFEQSNSCGLVHAWKDSTDFAAELHFPVIIVAKHNEHCIERLVLAWSYARTMGLTVAGLVTVETSPGEGKVMESKLTRSEVDLLLNSRTHVPYLGCLKFSPSISVQRVNQGNLVKMTESGIDLLAVRQALEAAVAK